MDEQERRSNGQFGSGGATTPPKAAGGESKPKLGGLKGELTSIKKMAEHWKGAASNPQHPDHAQAAEKVKQHAEAIKHREAALKDPEVTGYSAMSGTVTLKNGEKHKVKERYK